MDNGIKTKFIDGYRRDKYYTIVIQKLKEYD